MRAVPRTLRDQPIDPDTEAASEAPIFYRALCTRDRRFDGRFFTGVLTTGIYCRPVCPARTPLFKNVRFYKTAAAAEAEGFRPCQRCRPESAPGTPAWIGSSATVSRALRLIRSGAGEGMKESVLAARLGIGERRLRQLFAEHLGASPQAVVRVQRLDFARRLLDETSLPMSEVARGAGFRSIRRFNDAVKARFGKPPSLLRRERRQRADGDLVLRLPYRPPYAWDALSRFLKARAIPGVEAVTESSYSRTFTLGGTDGILEVRPTPDEASLTLRLRTEDPARLGAGLMDAVERVRTLFDLEADPLRITDHLGGDPRLAPAIMVQPGLRVPGGWDGFELAVRAILGQQVSVKGATTLSGRLVRELGRPIEVPPFEPAGASDSGSLSYIFPTPEALAGADLTRIGIPRARAAALSGLAQRVVSGGLQLCGAADVSATVQSLLEVPGIGPWTAQYIAMRVLRDPDAFPSTDLVLRRCVGDGDTESWRPFRAYAALYLWSSAG
jgi:AraC family transcriptional regulator of adaptative response / DNA-3-methyladenine glycosylase II